MPVFLAMAVLTAVSAYTSYKISENASQDAQAEQQRLQKQQEDARVASTQRELGIAQQRTNTALTGARTRAVNTQQSFSPNNSVMGGLPAVQSKTGNSGGTGVGNMNAGSAGTF